MAKKRKQQVDDDASKDQADETVHKDRDDDHDDDAAISSEEEDESPPLTAKSPSTAAAITSDGRYHNKQRLLLISSRGVTARYRHLLEDLRTLIPHSKKESKLDVGKNYSGSANGNGGGYGAAVNEIAEVRGCHTVMFLECRKKGQDGYLWMGRTCHANTQMHLSE